MMIETWREGYRELVANHLLVELYRSVRPVFCKVPHRRPEQIGSSILIQLGEMRFLVTAKHVWDECEAGGAEILLDPGGQPSREELLVVQSELEGHDFSIALLPDGCSAESFFLTPRDIDLRDSNDASKLQWIYGWPLEGNRKLFSPYSTRCKGSRPGAVLMRAFSAPAEWSGNVGSFGHSARTHLAVRYDPKSLARQGQSGPNPRGTSGGGVWYLPDMFNPRTRFLSAVITRWKENILLGIKLQVVLTTLCGHFPELRASVPELEVL